MNHLRINLLLAIASISPALAIMIAWLADKWFNPSHWMAQLSILTGALILASCIASMLMARASRGQLIVQKYLNLLANMDSSEMHGYELTNPPKELRDGNPWFSVFRSLQNRLTELSARVRDMEMDRAGLEVRSVRNESKHDRIASILDKLNDPILAVDEYEELILANPSASDLFNFQLEKGEKQLLGDLVECQKLIDLMRETGRRRSMQSKTDEIELINDDGESNWYKVVTRSLSTDGAGAMDHTATQQGTVAILRDISGHKEIQKRNAEFVSSVSHEMKTPLAGIKAYVELLMDGDAEDQQTREEFLDVINSQANRLQRLVENLLNIARIEAGVVKVSKDEQSLNSLMEDVMGIMQPVADDKKIQLNSEFSPMYLGVLLDHDMMLQAAINLISNAIKYTPSGRQVTVRTRMAGNWVELEIEDQGVGLSDEDQARVFEKFYRVQKDKSMAGGTGLGLPLAKHIVEDVHQGQLVVHSEVDVGSTFRIRLPGAGQISS